MALGNAVGSNIVNFVLTLCLASIFAPLLVRMRLLPPLLLLLLGSIGMGISGRIILFQRPQAFRPRR